jgi:hypothetical protein
MNRESSSLSPPIMQEEIWKLREWLSGRASPCQGESRGFDPRLPLQSVWVGGNDKELFLTQRDMHHIDHDTLIHAGYEKLLQLL